MKYLFLFAFFLAFARAQAQSLPLKVVAAAGNVVSGGGLTLSFTVGEVAIHAVAANNLVLKEGFWQQGLNYNITSDIVEIGGETLDIRVFPNPTLDQFFVTIDGNAPPLRCLLIDFSGRNVETQTVSAGAEKIAFSGSNFPTGIYLLRLETLDGATVQTFKLQKM
jgi:hypothetical protein